MPINLRGRSLLTLDDYSPSDIRFLLRLAAELKAAKLAGTERQWLTGRNIALIFEKDRPAPGPASKWPPMTRAPTSPISDQPGARSATRNR